MTDADEFKFETYAESGERRRAFVISAISGVIFAIIFIITSIIARFTMQEGWFYQVDSGIVARWGLAVFIEFSLLVLAVIFAYVVSHDRYERRKLKSQKEFLRQKEGRLAASGTNVTFHELWTSNNDRIDFYHEIATSQSRASFRAAQVTAIIGFIMVLALGSITVFFASGATAIAASITGAAAAAMSGYIGSTFLKSQAEASAQLRVFFSQPVEFARLLSAERLVEERVAKDKQGDAIQEIIKGVVSQGGQQGSPGIILQALAQPTEKSSP